MKKENLLVLALILIALGSYAVFTTLKSPPSPVEESSPAAQKGSATVAGAGIAWKDYTPGLAMARDAQKSVFLYFHAPWCTYCTKLKETTFKDDKVLAYLNENFISIQVDTDQNRGLAAEWNVTGLPTLWFLEPDGKKINRIPGYVAPAQMLQILKYIHTKSYTTMEFQEFVNQG